MEIAVKQNMTLAINCGTLVLPDRQPAEGSLYICQGHIANIRLGRDTSFAADHIIDASGMVVLPGCIDPHVHFREPGLTHKEDITSGSRACAKGGITTYLEMPNTIPPTIDSQTITDKYQRAKETSLVNFGFFVGATHNNIETIEAIAGIPGVKLFLGSMHGPLLFSDDTALERLFAQGNHLIAVHAEEQTRIALRRATYQKGVESHSLIQDPECAVIALRKVLKLAAKYKRRLHILHVSTREEVDILRAEKTGFVTAEVTPQHLFLDVSSYSTLGSCVQMNPPIRSAEHGEALWSALLDGTLDFIATDHAPHLLSEKAQPYPTCPSGMPGVETSLPLILTQVNDGKISLSQAARYMSQNAAQAYGIQGKGRLEIGADADVVIVDMARKQQVTNETLATKCKWSPFVGRTLTGWPVYTVVNGHVVFANGTFPSAPMGQPVRCSR